MQANNDVNALGDKPVLHERNRLGIGLDVINRQGQQAVLDSVIQNDAFDILGNVLGTFSNNRGQINDDVQNDALVHEGLRRKKTSRNSK